MSYVRDVIEKLSKYFENRNFIRRWKKFSCLEPVMDENLNIRPLSWKE